ncbi:MAG: cytochrome c [Bryobacteraceae bacterium]
MKILYRLGLTMLLATAAFAADSYKGDQCADPKLTAEQRAGCKIWFYATAGNGRFHAYVLPQRLPVLLDWYRVLNSKERSDRFKAWGIINDPECCVPGSVNCPKKSLSETFGMDYCPGDDDLLKFVGKQGYKDPACDFTDSPPDPRDPHKGQRDSSCALEFGTSTGALGIRKFPNPRFDAEKWSKVNNGTDTWNGFNALVKPDLFHSRLRDASIEPPFYFGMSCGACHIAFDPLNPPKDPANPKSENILGAIGNQYTNVTAIMASGEATNSPLWRIFNYVRAGTIDTSAFPHDFTGNPGTPNALANLTKRPTFPDEDLVKWWKTDHCAAGADPNTCWCEPGMNNKCWERRQKKATDPMDPMSPVMHILKGGEDSIGALEAIQRVYLNIGSCSETCWLNHLSNFFVADPTQRNFFQTPFDIGQCRRDCPNFRAVEDRLPEIASFLFAQKPSDLYAARGLKSNEQLSAQLDGEFGAGSVKLGQQLFADNCARCHSSQKPDATGSFKNVDFLKTDASGVREDFLSNDVAQKVSEIGTNRSRALHSNHMEGHVWEQYGSSTLRSRSADPNIPDPSDGGRGYYRSTTLLSAWAHAPFLHNNAIGPEICGKPQNKVNDFYASPYVDANDKPLPNPPACWAYDPTVAGRFKLYKASMDELLTVPEKRPRKVTLLNEPIIIEAGPKVWHPVSRKMVGLRIVIPTGTPQAMVGNLLYKQLLDDMVLSRTNPTALKAKLKDDQAASDVAALLAEFLDLKNISEPMKVIENPKYKKLIMKYYMTSTDFWENSGHPFGTGLTDKEKKALTAFVAML